MLKLIKCEFLKLKRKKFIPLIILAAFLFPIPLTYLMTTPSMMERYTDRADAFDGLFNMVLGYGIQFLLPCIIGVIAAILFFMERDNDTFKNLRTIPVTSTQMVLAKIIVLFIFGIVFCVASTIAKEQIFEAVWHKDSESYLRAVTSTIGRIRQKIEDDKDHPRYIKTVSNIGYQFVPSSELVQSNRNL